MTQKLTEKTNQLALDSGADLVGVVGVENLAEHAEDIQKILPGAKSVVVVAAKHSLAAIRSENIQMGQFDTIHAYNQSAHAAHRTGRYLESLKLWIDQKYPRIPPFVELSSRMSFKSIVILLSRH